MTNASIQHTFKGNDRVLIGFILGLLTFWLFAMTLLNVNVEMQADLGINVSSMNLAVSISSLFSGLFIVIAGGLGDKFGYVKMTNVGFIFAILGSLLVAFTPANSALSIPVLMLGRVFQGLSAACIMPSTLALLREYWDEKGRQRAISLWSMGSWGGTSFSAVFGGAMLNQFGWRSIFYVSATVGIIGLLLIQGMPEARAKSAHGDKKRVDIPGVLLFIIAIVSLQLLLTQGAGWGWTSPTTLVTAAVAIVFLILFIVAENRAKDPFIDFSLFKNRTFTGATVSNFILNGSAGVITITLSLLQLGGNISPDVAGYLTIGYGVTIILFIRVGEKLLQRFGARRPMIWGCLIVLLSILLMLPTNIMTKQYMVLMVISYVFFGLGLAFYATPSTDAALMSLPADKAGAGSGIYKMASSLGASFGLALSAAIFTGVQISNEPVTILDNVITFVGRQDNLVIRHGAMLALLFNVLLILFAILVIHITIPKQGKSKA